ncbi:hypothetical protein V6N11_032966 [Hibiscus sabdariffa]|uniref:Uncharacterized protein n=1 Tax=Hibiscus sabdariffa TaxID=183260 RepID=A0ABR1ZDQ7_9ROSI
MHDASESGIRIGKDLRRTGSSENGGRDKHPMVVSQGVIMHGKTSLNSAKHTMVEVGEVERALVARSAKGRVLPLSIKGGNPLGLVKKGVGLLPTQKMSLKPKKKYDRGTSKATLAASLSPLIAELDSMMNDDTREWDWERLRGMLPQHFLEQIAAELPPNSDTGQGSLRFFAGFCGRTDVVALWGLNVCTARSCWGCNACVDRMVALDRGRDATSMEYEDPPVELLDLI